MKTLEKLIRELPSELQREVLDFAEFLLHKQRQKCGRKLHQNWAGALKEYREQYTSLELQKKPLNGEVTNPVCLVDINVSLWCLLI